MAKIFEEQVIKITEQKLMQSLEKLNKDALLQQKFRKLAELSSTLEKHKEILKDSSLKKDSREKWRAKRDILIVKRDKLYSQIEYEGFEHWWIITIVNNEMKKYKKVIDNEREEAYKKYFGEVCIDDIDIFDNRWELIGQQIKQAKTNYIEGK